MDKVKTAVGYNLLVLVVYTALNGLIGDIFVLAVFILAHFLISFITGIRYFTRNDSKNGRAFLLSSFLVLLIGFSACFGIFFT